MPPLPHRGNGFPIDVSVVHVAVSPLPACRPPSPVNGRGDDLLLSPVYGRETEREGSRCREYRQQQCGATTHECLNVPSPAGTWRQAGKHSPLRNTILVVATLRSCHRNSNSPVDGKTSSHLARAPLNARRRPSHCAREHGMFRLRRQIEPRVARVGPQPSRSCAPDAA